MPKSAILALITGPETRKQLLKSAKKAALRQKGTENQRRNLLSLVSDHGSAWSLNCPILHSS